MVNKPDSHGGGLDWTKICEKSSKVITFIDLAGHEKYLKTTVFGMTGHLPDFCMLMVREIESLYLTISWQILCYFFVPVSALTYLTTHLVCFLSLHVGWQQCWHCWHDQRAPGSSAGPKRTCVCCGYQDRHVPS